VIKIVSPDIIHKVDVGGVRLNLTSEGELRQAYKTLIAAVQAARPTARLQGVLVQQMVTGGKETILGMKRDPQFGPLLLCGLGGTYVEIFKDVAVRIAPITTLEAHPLGLPGGASLGHRRDCGLPRATLAARPGLSGASRARHESLDRF